MHRNDFESHVVKFNDMRYFETDPVSVVRRCSDKKDIEVMGMVCSWLALGNRDQIYKRCVFSYELMGEQPYAYVMGESWREYKDLRKNYYRMFFYEDFHDLMESLLNIYKIYDSIEDAVIDYIEHHKNAGYVEALTYLMKAKGIPKDCKSACKRLCLFLRWMVRRDGIVDIGIWQRLDPARLLIPLDVHVNNVARGCGLIKRMSSDMKAVEELTAHCREIYPEDPCAMDFALFGFGYTSK